MDTQSIATLEPIAQQKRMDFQEFLQWYPENGERYELIDGVPSQVRTIGPHEDIVSFLSSQFWTAIRQHQLPYAVHGNCLICSQSEEESGYIPDIAIMDREKRKEEKLWSTASSIENGSTIPLAVEVVSTNWSNDYGRKLIDYEQLGIQEYWIVDYRGLGAARYIGSPKKPTITILQLEEGEYIEAKFRAGDTLISGIFPDLTLTADEIFAAAD